MIWTVYKTTHLPSGKFYIGVHKTRNPNDSYLGSGKYLKAAVKKHGKDAFQKEVLFSFDNPEAAYAKEAELATEAFAKREDTYNLMRGGIYSRSDKFGLHGEENPQYGKRWVVKGAVEKRVPSAEFGRALAEGWMPGRKRKAPKPTKPPEEKVWMTPPIKGQPRKFSPSKIAELEQKGWLRGRATKERPKRPKPPTQRCPSSYARGECSGGAKLDWATVRGIRQLYAEGGFSYQDLARLFGVSHAAIGSLIRGKTWIEEGKVA